MLQIAVQRYAIFLNLQKNVIKKHPQHLMSVADAVICLLIVKGSRAAVNLLRKVNCRERQVNMPAAWLKAAELRLICFARLIVASDRLKAAGQRLMR